MSFSLSCDGQRGRIREKDGDLKLLELKIGGEYELGAMICHPFLQKLSLGLLFWVKMLERISLLILVPS